MKRIIGVRLWGGITEEQKAIILKSAPGFEILDIDNDGDGDNIATQLAQCEIVFGNIAPEQFARAKNLKWVHTQSAGVEAYCQPGASQPPYLLTNSAGAYGIAISEHLVTMAMMLLRHMPGYVVNMQSREWKSLGKVRSVYGSTIAVAGLGDIGSCFAQRMNALGATVKAIVRKTRDEYPNYIAEACLSSDIVRTDEILAEADIIALCLPHTAETVNFLSAARLAKLKRDVIILNVGRGSAIDEDALAEALMNGHIGGAGLDVTTVEPLPQSSPLWAFPNTIITPHMSGGGSLDFTIELILNKFTRYLNDYVNGRPFAIAVDRSAGY